MTGEVRDGRQRVRDVVIAPAQQDGMRFKRGTPADKAQAYLDRLVDQLAYLRDEPLAVVAAWLRSHGDGADRSFWPPMVALVSLAEALQPRPVEELPGVASWFGSVAGPAARAADRLVAEFDWWTRKKRPPLKAHEWRLVEEQAARFRRQLLVLRERRADGRHVAPDEAAFERWYLAIEARAEALIAAGEARRRGTDDAA